MFQICVSGSEILGPVLIINCELSRHLIPTLRDVPMKSHTIPLNVELMIRIAPSLPLCGYPRHSASSNGQRVGTERLTDLAHLPKSLSVRAKDSHQVTYRIELQNISKRHRRSRIRTPNCPAQTHKLNPGAVSFKLIVRSITTN